MSTANSNIIYKKGNILDRSINKCGVVAHGVNCSGGFGSGLAGQIAKTYPFVKESYLKKHVNLGWWLGDVQRVHIDDSLEIWNMATQRKYGRDKNTVYVNYDALDKCLINLFSFCEEENINCSIPKIGCGLANGDWDIVKATIQKHMLNKTFFLEIYEL